jgi:Transcription factor/nuclear export subunit protein 2
MVPFSILQYLNSTTKSKLDYHGVGISQWLQNISCFTGEFFRNYYKTEMTGILSYIADCLAAGQVVEICILKQILSKMSGWNPPENLTEKMLNSLAGGPKLKIAAYKLGEDRSKTTKSSLALCTALQQKWPGGKLNFSMELAILAGNQANMILYSKTGDFKILGLLYDNLISSIVLLIDILSLQYNEAKTYAELLPAEPIIELSKEYKLSLPLVMYIVRPGIDISKFESVIDQLSSITPDSQIPIQFFAVFWALSLADIRSAEAEYNSESNLLKQSGIKNGVKNQQVIDQLNTESTFLKYRQTFFADFIKKHTNIPKECNLANELVQKGIYPRLLCSPSDALYCAYFIETMMKLQINDFPIFELINKCIVLILPCINCCTEGEASNIGFFFLELLRILSGWKTGLETEGKNFSAFKDISVKVFRDNITAYYDLIAKVLCGSLSESFLVQKNCLNVINRIFPEFPNTKETAKEIMDFIKPIKDSEMEDLKLIAQRVYDNLEKKFSEIVQPVVLPKKRSYEKTSVDRKSHDRSEEKKKNGNASQERNTKNHDYRNKSRNDNRRDRSYDNDKRQHRRDDNRYKDYQRRNY